MFLRSDTNMLVLSALPIFPEGSPLSPEIMDVTRRPSQGSAGTSGSCCTRRRCPTSGGQRAALDAMEHTAQRYPVAAWKTFTHFPGAFEGDGNGWWLDDRDGGDLGERFIRKAVDLGIPNDLHPQGALARQRRSPRPTTSVPRPGGTPT